MLNEIQKNARMGNFVRFGIFATILLGLIFLVLGVGELTKSWPKPESEAFAPKLKSGPKVSMAPKEESRETVAPLPPEKVGVFINGALQEVEAE